MSAKYTVVQRGDPRNPSAPKKYYPQYTSAGRVDFRHLAEKMSSISTISSIDAAAMLEALIQIIPEELADGNIVDLGEFGTFKLRIHGEGAEASEAVNAGNIRAVHPQFFPGKLFKQAIRSARFEKV